MSQELYVVCLYEPCTGKCKNLKVKVVLSKIIQLENRLIYIYSSSIRRYSTAISTTISFLCFWSTSCQTVSLPPPVPSCWVREKKSFTWPQHINNAGYVYPLVGTYCEVMISICICILLILYFPVTQAFLTLHLI